MVSPHIAEFPGSILKIALESSQTPGLTRLEFQQCVLAAHDLATDMSETAYQRFVLQARIASATRHIAKSIETCQLKRNNQ
jgi:CRP-like cAMP-binding protein